MYPTIYDAVKDLFGISIPFLKLLQSFGFFVALAFLLCAWVFAKELRRKEMQGLLQPTFRKITKGAPATRIEMAGQFLFGYLIGWKILSIPFSGGLFNANPRNYILSGSGNIYLGLAAGFALAYLRWWQSNKHKLAEPKEEQEKVSAADHVGNMTLIAAIFGFLGAKIFHILENFGDFLKDPSGLLFSFSGLTMYGGLILGGIAVLIYAKKQGFNILHVMDACAPGLFLAYGVGRIGCHVAGDGDWGIVNVKPKPHWLSFLPNWIWSYNYPNNVNGTCNPDERNPAYALSQLLCDPAHPALVQPVYPTPFYEAMINIIFFFVLWSQRKKFSTPGLVFSVFLIFNGVERFFIEIIRVDTVLFHIGSFEVVQAQIIAVCLITLGTIGCFWTKKRARLIPS